MQHMAWAMLEVASAAQQSCLQQTWRMDPLEMAYDMQLLASVTGLLDMTSHHRRRQVSQWVSSCSSGLAVAGVQKGAMNRAYLQEPAVFPHSFLHGVACYPRESFICVDERH